VFNGLTFVILLLQNTKHNPDELDYEDIMGPQSSSKEKVFFNCLYVTGHPRQCRPSTSTQQSEATNFSFLPPPKVPSSTPNPQASAEMDDSMFPLDLSSAPSGNDNQQPSLSPKTSPRLLKALQETYEVSQPCRASYEVDEFAIPKGHEIVRLAPHNCDISRLFNSMVMD
jgi:hypothetical protein